MGARMDRAAPRAKSPGLIGATLLWAGGVWAGSEIFRLPD